MTPLGDGARPTRSRPARGARRVPRAAGLAVGPLLLFAAATFALAHDDGPILHEYVAPPSRAGAGRIVDPRAFAPRATGDGHEPGPGSSEGALRNPIAIRSGARLLAEPPMAATPAPNEPTFGRGGFGADRETATRPDRATSADGRLHYVEVFNPSVVPFKRMSALDAVHPDYTLSLADPARTELPVGGAADEERDLFWASMLVELAPGRDVPIPSVAPDMRILSYEVEPAVRLVFSKDGADNFFLRSDDPRADGVHRVVFLADAAASYFGVEVPHGHRVGDAARSGLVRPLPEPVRRRAEELFPLIRVSRSQPLDVAVDRLVEYFRGFQAGAPPADTGDLYRDLTLARRGVCRHRAFAFVITANALGIPARYVANEAHAFAEIWVPERGWLRVDLGGAALELDVSNAGRKSMHRPREPDPFPRPPEYDESYTRLRGDVRGLSRRQLAEAWGGPGRGGPNVGPDDPRGAPPIGTGDPSGAPGTGTHDPGDVAQDDGDLGGDTGDPFDGSGDVADDPRDALGGGSGDRRDPSNPTRLLSPAPAPGRGPPRPPDAALSGKTPTSIVVTEVDPVGFRGERVRVSGRVRAGGDAAAGLRVDVYLAPEGRGGDRARLVGRAVTDSHGLFAVAVDLPADLPLGAYEVFAATPGDATRAPALSE